MKSGAGQLTLTGANTFSGATTIGGGTLEASAANALGGTSGVVVNTGRTLLLSGTGDRVKNTAGFTLGGGTLDTAGAGVSETLGVLTLSSTSTINLGATTNVLNFADSSAATWGGGLILTVCNWSGSATDQIFFGSSSTGLTAPQLAEISFLDPAGAAPGLYGAQLLGTGGAAAGSEKVAWALAQTPADFGLKPKLLWRRDSSLAATHSRNNRLDELRKNCRNHGSTHETSPPARSRRHPFHRWL